MADAPRLDLVYKAIRAGYFNGNVQWKDAAARLVRANAEMNGLSPEGIKHLLRAFVLAGGQLTVRPETRAEYKDQSPYWYRAILSVEAIPCGLFVELVLFDLDEEEPWVEIVSAHPQQS